MVPNLTIFLCNIHHRVKKVCATDIMLDRGTTIMAFIPFTNLHAVTTRCQRSRKLSMPLQKASNSRLFK